MLIGHADDPPKAWIFEPRSEGSQSSNSSPPSQLERGQSEVLVVSPHGGIPLRGPEEPRTHFLVDRFLTYTTATNALYGSQ